MTRSRGVQVHAALVQVSLQSKIILSRVLILQQTYRKD